jgi:hypothetical protein
MVVGKPLKKRKSGVYPLSSWAVLGDGLEGIEKN